ncbi:MAG: hypothetical protein JKY59_05815 [Emcibacter sp.]|nr:hypothetical protein [Emcibacter sp.]
MRSTTLTLDNLKLQARRMRDHFAEKNIDLSHSAALEVLAKQHGFKDWNILSAILKISSKSVNWPELEDRIKGTYLGHAFTGKILKLQTTHAENNRRYTIRFDKPIDVVTSRHFSNYRQRINCFLDQSLQSVNHKGQPDNIVQIT